MSVDTLNIAEYCLEDFASREPERLALIFDSPDTFNREEPDRSFSFGEILSAVESLAGALRGRGLKKGDRVLIRLENSPEYAFLFFAALRAGLIAVPASPRLTESEIAVLIHDCRPALIVHSNKTAPPKPAGIIARYDDLLAEGKSTGPLRERTLAEDPAFLVYTSGTTGSPRGVLHAHRVVRGRRLMRAGWTGLETGERILHAGELNWTYTMGVGVMDPWAVGATALLYDRGARNASVEPSVWPRLMEKRRAAVFAAVPGLYRRILKYTNLKEYNLSLKRGLCAGEALSSDLLEAWQVAAGTPLYEALGMSECSTYISSGPETPIRPGSPGRPQNGRRVKILAREPDDPPPAPGETGVIAVHRSDPGLMLGYWNDPEGTAERFRGEWFLTGDLAGQDADGYIHYAGRDNDLMNVQGYRVSPLEIERVLADHPRVAEVAAAEIKVRSDLSIIAAFLVPASQTNTTQERESLEGELRKLADARLASYKQPREYRFLEQLPRTPNGKVKRDDLRL